MHVACTLRSGGLFSLLVVLLLTFCRASFASPADNKQCAQAHVEAQKLMRSGALKKARDQLKVCGRDECIAPVRKDCTAWLDEAQSGIASIVVEAKGPDGQETFDVKLSIGGELIMNRLDLRAIELDPGTYKLQFEREGSTPIEREVVVRQGQKNKVVEISFAKSATSGTSSPSSSSPQPSSSSSSDAIQPKPNKSIAPWIVGGAGVALAATGGVFWFLSESSRSDLVAANCSPRCDSGDVDGIKTQRLIGDVLMGVGAVAIGAAIVWLVFDGGRSAPSSRR